MTTAGTSARVEKIDSGLAGEIVLPATDETRTEYVLFETKLVSATVVVALSTDVQVVAVESLYSTLYEAAAWVPVGADQVTVALVAVIAETATLVGAPTGGSAALVNLLLIR